MTLHIVRRKFYPEVIQSCFNIKEERHCALFMHGLKKSRCTTIIQDGNSLGFSWKANSSWNDFLFLAWQWFDMLFIILNSMESSSGWSLFSIVLYIHLRCFVFSYLAPGVLKEIFYCRIHSLLSIIIILQRFIGVFHPHNFEGFPHSDFVYEWFNFFSIIQYFPHLKN